MPLWPKRQCEREFQSRKGKNRRCDQITGKMQRKRQTIYSVKKKQKKAMNKCAFTCLKDFI
jgi:hypothetical protein